MENMVKDKVREKDVLDLGCGSGLFTDKLRSWGARPAGIGVSEQMVKVARKSFPDISSDIEDAEKLPYLMRY
jgi:predicted TPR repeat methyltransferase